MKKEKKFKPKKKDLEEFDRIVSLMDSVYQMDRIQGRLKLPKFEERFTKEQMDEMWEIIKSW